MGKREELVEGLNDVLGETKLAKQVAMLDATVAALQARMDSLRVRGPESAAASVTSPDLLKHIRQVRAMGFVGPEESRALSRDPESAGALVPEAVAQSIIELIRARSVVRQLPGVRIVSDLTGTGSYRIPRIAEGAATVWVDENDDISVSQVRFDQVVLQPHRIAALLPVSNDLLDDTTIAAESFLREELARALADGMDDAFLLGQPGGANPVGLRYLASQADGTLTDVSEGGAPVDVEYEHLVDALVAVTSRGFTPQAWIGHPRLLGRLLKLTDNNGLPIFVGARGSLAAAPEDRLLGLPMYLTSRIPADPATGETFLILVDSTQIVIGDWRGITVEASREATYTDGTTVVSAFQRNQTLLRAQARTDLKLRHAGAVQVVTGIRA